MPMLLGFNDRLGERVGLALIFWKSQAAQSLNFLDVIDFHELRSFDINAYYYGSIQSARAAPEPRSHI